MKTKLWRVSRSPEPEYSEYVLRSTFTSPEPLCRCGRVELRWPRPVELEWCRGSDLIGDFAHARDAGGVIAVALDTAHALHEAFPPLEWRTPHFVDTGGCDGDYKRGPRVSAELAVPDLRLLRPPRIVKTDIEASSLEPQVCPECGRTLYRVLGAECYDIEVDAETYDSHWLKTPRRPGAGLFVAASELRADCLFRVREFPAAVFCTDGVREFIQDRGWSNVELLEEGETS